MGLIQLPLLKQKRYLELCIATLLLKVLCFGPLRLKSLMDKITTLTQLCLPSGI